MNIAIKEIFRAPNILCKVRNISTSHPCLGKLPDKLRRRQKQAPGDRSNIFCQTPDWSFSDGTPMPPTRLQNKELEIQKQICQRIITLNKEIEEAKSRHNEHIEINNIEHMKEQ